MEGHGHIPVLLEEILQLLSPQAGETFIDCTAGRGGHSAALAGAIGAAGTIIGMDLDDQNLAHAERRVSAAGVRFIGIHDSFARLDAQLVAVSERLGRPICAAMLLADLGFSSTQMDDPARGFSFSVDGPLDMRFDRRSPTTAAELLATLTERELADVIFRYGEDPFARKIARKLALARRDQPIVSTVQLARLVEEAYGPRARFSRMHPATRTFMALRIAVNDELGALGALLDQIARAAERAQEQDTWLAPGARVAIVSFHSLEDRMVKHAFADLEKRSLAARLTKKPIVASAQEAQTNPRARSAKLRAVRIASGEDAAQAR